VARIDAKIDGGAILRDWQKRKGCRIPNAAVEVVGRFVECRVELHWEVKVSGHGRQYRNPGPLHINGWRGSLLGLQFGGAPPAVVPKILGAQLSHIRAASLSQQFDFPRLLVPPIQWKLSRCRKFTSSITSPATCAVSSMLSRRSGTKLNGSGRRRRSQTRKYVCIGPFHNTMFGECGR
jgi:hypothetical protein